MTVMGMHKEAPGSMSTSMGEQQICTDINIPKAVLLPGALSTGLPISDLLHHYGTYYAALNSCNRNSHIISCEKDLPMQQQHCLVAAVLAATARGGICML
jgi:hypothetical protein